MIGYNSDGVVCVIASIRKGDDKKNKALVCTLFKL